MMGLGTYCNLLDIRQGQTFDDLNETHDLQPISRSIHPCVCVRATGSGLRLSPGLDIDQWFSYFGSPIPLKLV
jgi:hypothetical protein